MTKVLMKGTEAIAEAAVQAGCKYFYGYPITPQNEIPEYMSKRLFEVGGVYLQAESEVAASNMILGGAATGERVMTSSSSPGVSLMSEAMSYIAGQELPVVVVNVMRGGTANCGVTISDGEISSPFVTRADVVVVLNQPSLDKYEPTVKKGGILIYNEDMASYHAARDDIRVIPVHATRIAESVGNERALNVVLLGVLTAVSDFIADETARNVIREKLGAKKPQFLESNLKAYEAGKELAKSLTAKQ